jgi:hypothetical protein
MRSVPKTRIQADILLSQDVLSYLQSGGRIITHTARKSKNKPIKPLTVLSARCIKL